MAGSPDSADKAIVPPTSRRRRALRFAWRHRLASLVFLCLTWVLVLRLIWGGYLAHQIAAQNEQIRQRGEPAEWAELRFDLLPDSENGCRIIDKAAALDDGSSPANTNNSFPDYPPLGTQWDQAAAASEQSNRAVFQLARQARLVKKGQILRSLPALGFSASLPTLNAGRQIANTVSDGALYKHLMGDDVEAIQRTIDVLHLSSFLRQDEFQVSQLVAIGVDLLALAKVQVMAPGLRLSDPAVRREAEALIRYLQEEQDTVDGYRKSLPFEHALRLQADSLEATGVWFLRPLSDHAGTRSLRDLIVALDACKSSNAEDVRRSLAMAGVDVARRRAAGAGIASAHYAYWFDRRSIYYSNYFEQLYRVLGERRVTVVSLAMQLYHADHGGWPNNLNELVPAYLPAIPLDPFYNNQRLIGYILLRSVLPDGRDRPLLSFDASQTGTIDSEPMYGWQYLSSGGGVVRQFRDVDQWSPKVRRWDQANPPPATQPASPDASENDASKPDAPGEKPQEKQQSQ